MARLRPSSRKTLSAGLQQLRNRLKPVLSPRCTHVKERGGVKRSVRELKKKIRGFCFMARFDVASYYDSMQHFILLDLLVKAGVDEPLRALVRQYLEAPEAVLRSAMRALFESQPELKRQMVVRAYISGDISLGKAAEIMGISHEEMKEAYTKAALRFI